MSSLTIGTCYCWLLVIFVSLAVVTKANADIGKVILEDNLDVWKEEVFSDKEIAFDIIKLANRRLIKKNMFLDVRLMSSKMFEPEILVMTETTSTSLGLGGFFSSSLYFGVIPVVIILLLLFIIIFMCTSQNDLSPSEQESKTHVTEVNQLLPGRKSLYKRYVDFHFEKALPYPPNLSHNELEESPKEKINDNDEGKELNKAINKKRRRDKKAFTRMHEVVVQPKVGLVLRDDSDFFENFCKQQASVFSKPTLLL